MSVMSHPSRATGRPVQAVAMLCLIVLCAQAVAGPWVDSYWPLRDGDSWLLAWDMNKPTAGTVTISVSEDSWVSPDFYEISAEAESEGETEWAYEAHWKDGDTVKYTGNGANGGWVRIRIDPPVLLFDEDLLMNGGTRTTRTTVTQNGYDYSATFKVTVTKMAGAVKVPAGTFRDCRSFTVTETVAGTSYTAMTAVLAPGVGLIRKVVKLQPRTWAELVSTSFPLPLPQAGQAITFPTLPVKGLGDPDFDPGATSSSGLPVEYASSNTSVARIENRLVHIVGAGTAEITASQPGNVGYMAAAAVKRKLTVNVVPLWAQGSFSGWFVSTTDCGPISIAVTPQGKITGKLSAAGTTYTFGAPSYARRDATGAFWLSCEAKAGKAVLPLTLTVRNLAGAMPTTLAVADGWFAATAAGEPAATLFRNVWKDAGMAAVAADYAGYYTAVLPGRAEYGSGYLTLTVDQAGGFKAAGKLADGTAVSLSGALVLDEAGRVFAVLYTSPAAYKGGSLFGLAEFSMPEYGDPVILRLLDDGVPFVWENRNPQATAAYGVGFSRELGLTGGWYDKVDNLYHYYWGRTLAVDTDDRVTAPGLTVGANRYASVWWDPDGVSLTPVLNRSGTMTGLAAPKPGVPVDPERDGVWYYGAENAVGLKLSLTRATGIYKGSFKAWFDDATKHTSKSIAFAGVLTPEREGWEDGVEGRGFFLWADKGQYLNTQGKTVSYPYNHSYDFRVRVTP